jgi:hypothetical protein
MTLIYNPETEKAPLATMTVLKLDANHEGEVHEFFQHFRDMLEEGGIDGSDYAQDNGAYHIVHASEDIHLAKKMKEANVHLEGSLCFALMRFAQALAQHAVVFELHWPDGFKCRLQFI